METMKLLILFTITYLIGSIPSAYIYCRIRGKDITKEGSGNVGATNAARLFGKSAFITVFILDALKGFIPVFFLSPIFISNNCNIELIYVLTFFMAIIGHIFSVFLKFKGGKGVATSVGGLIAILPLPCLLSAFIFGIIFYLTKIVSVGSISAALSLPVFVFILHYSKTYLIFSIILCILIIVTHKANIKRLIAGTEKNFKAKKD